MYIVELGSGHGKLAFHILRHLTGPSMRKMWPWDPCTDSSRRAYPFKYVITDFSKNNVDFLRDHPPLQPYAKAGLVDFALFGALLEPLPCEEAR